MKRFNLPKWVTLGLILGMAFNSLQAIESLQTTVSRIFSRDQDKSVWNKDYVDPIQILTGTIPGNTIPFPPNPRLGNGYGSALDFDGEHLVVASPTAKTNGVLNAGAIYFYEKDKHGQYVQMQEPFSESVTSDFLGAFTSVHLHGDFLMVSAGVSQAEQGAGSPTHPGGAVLFFELEHKHKGDVWVLKQVLEPNDLSLGDNFGGRHLYFNDKWAFIGAAYQTEDDQIAGGAVYIFRFDKSAGLWVQTQKLLDPDGYFVPHVEFGSDVIIKGNYAMIAGENNFLPGFANNGTVYVYHLQPDGTWQKIQTLTGNQESGAFPFGDLFGFSIDFNDHWAVISAVTDSTGSSADSLAAGAVYFFEAVKINGVKQWQLRQKIYSDAPSSFGAFGTHVAIQGKQAFISDMRPGDNGPHVGAVLGFERKKGVWGTTPFVTISNPRGLAWDYFGADFAVSGKKIAIGNIPNSDFFDPPGRDWTDPATQANDGEVIIYKINH